MFQWLNLMWFMPLAVLSISACEASDKEVGGADAGQQASAGHQISANKPGRNVTNQQVPINQRFSSLDVYLAHLERTQGPIDKPWYKEVRPGVYELQTGNLRVLGGEKQEHVFTREELERKFGFSK